MRATPGHQPTRTSLGYRRWLWMLGLGIFTAGPSPAEEKTADTNSPAPPRLVVALPPVVFRGQTNVINVRGLRLKEINQLRGLAGETVYDLALGESKEAAVPERFKPEQTGNQQLQVEWQPPTNLLTGTNAWLVGRSPVGESGRLPLFVLSPDEVATTLKPGKGFRDAPILPIGSFVHGALAEHHEIAVYRIEGRAGQKLRGEVWAQRLGSTLDGSLTWHDAHGAVLAMNDDTEGRDPVLNFTLPADGTFYLSLVGVDERPAPTHVYLLRLAAP